MGRSGRLLKLLGRGPFKEYVKTGSQLKVLPYSFNGVVREMQLKNGVNDVTALAILNVPYYLGDKAIRELFAKHFDAQIAQVQITLTTASKGEISKGYRSGKIVFTGQEDKEKVFAKCGAKMEPIDLQSLGIKLPVWHQQTGRKNLKRKAGEAETSAETIPNKNEPDADGWVTVTKEHKFSFPGKIKRAINRANPNESNKIAKEEQHLPPKKKKKR